MGAKKQLIDLCQTIGATIEVQEYRHVAVNIEAPKGHHFYGGLHELVNESEKLSEAYKDALERLRENLPCEPCTSECEWWDENNFLKEDHG